MLWGPGRGGCESFIFWWDICRFCAYDHENVGIKKTWSLFSVQITTTVFFDLLSNRICTSSSHQPVRRPRTQSAVSTLSNRCVSLSLSPALPHCSQVRLLLAGWEDETWSHSSRWWHWQEQPVTQNCLNRAEVRAICGWRRELRARGWWSSGLVRTNMSTYG